MKTVVQWVLFMGLLMFAACGQLAPGGSSSEQNSVDLGSIGEGDLSSGEEEGVSIFIEDAYEPDQGNHPDGGEGDTEGDSPYDGIQIPDVPHTFDPERWEGVELEKLQPLDRPLREITLPLQLQAENFGGDMPLVLIGSETSASIIHVLVGGSWGPKPKLRVQGGTGESKVWMETCTPESLGTNYDPISQFPLVAMQYDADASYVSAPNSDGEVQLNIEFFFWEEPSDPAGLETTCRVKAQSGDRVTSLDLKIQYFPADSIPTIIDGVAAPE